MGELDVVQRQDRGGGVGGGMRLTSYVLALEGRPATYGTPFRYRLRLGN